jgi:hypothetical protein
MTQNSFIYALVDPLTDRIRYVGQTNDLERRYKEHCTIFDFSLKCQWVQSLKTVGTYPTMMVLEVVDSESDVDFREAWWIGIGLQCRWELTNAGKPCRSVPQFSHYFSDALQVIKANHDSENAPMVSFNRNHLRTIYSVFAALVSGLLIYAVTSQDRSVGAIYGLSAAAITYLCVQYA